MTFQSRAFSMYCGDACDGLDSSEYLQWRGEFLLDKPEFIRVQKKMLLDDLMFLHQIHGVHGMAVIPADRERHSFITQGDFLISNTPGLGIGVMTADCIPVACYDSRMQTIGIAHAGWRGLIAGVIPAMIAALNNNYGTRVEDLTWWVGPCARACCYEVSADFMNNIQASDQKFVMHHNDGKWFFDGVGLLRRQLAKFGVADVSFDEKKALCTICTPRFCSYRRSCLQRELTTRRNMTIVALSE